MKAVPAKLTQTQHAFTAHIRAPAHAPAPTDVAPARMAVYRELLRNNIAGSLDACFPVLRRVLPPARWQALCEDFFAHHRCRTPIYRRVPDEFVAYLRDEYAPAADDPPFVAELAHYEWAELALSIDPQEIDEGAIERDGDLWNGVPYLNPLAWVLQYRYPVHRIGADTAVPVAATPTFIVVYRNRGDEIGFMELNAVSARMIALLRTDPSARGVDAATIIAQELGLASVGDLRSAAVELLETLRTRDVILGTVK